MVHLLISPGHRGDGETSGPRSPRVRCRHATCRYVHGGDVGVAGCSLECSKVSIMAFGRRRKCFQRAIFDENRTKDIQKGMPKSMSNKK